MTVCCGMRLVLVTPPAVEPLTVAEAKARLNIGDEVSDAVMQAYITAARQRIDGADGSLGRAINTQTWQGKADVFPTCDGGRIYIPLPPLQSLTVKYLDAAGSTVTLTEGVDYQLVQAQRPYIVPLTAWPVITGIDGLTIEFVAGYGDAGTDVPEPIRTAVALGAGNLSSMSAGNLGVIEEVEEGIGSTRYAVDKTKVVDAVDYTVECLLATYQVMYV
jgi:uncharacterized phiE125 gp8 family phage protein